MRTVKIVVGSVCLLLATAGAGMADEGARAGVAVDSAQVQALQGQMAGNPDLLSLVMSLQNDPEMQALLTDQKVLDAVQSGDYSSLLQDPRIRQLMQDPRVQELARRLQGQSTGERE